ncbi:MAG: hypothetical protein GC150_17280 [Rhizobiales bacterium]|nr:hypothetical protein [Hyphomicrobiales bacterium]
MTSSRICPVPGCGAPIRAGHLMCGPCWANVPKELQKPVNTSWRRVGATCGKDKLAALRTYRQAADAAVMAAEDRR